MTSYNMYPILPPEAPPPKNLQVGLLTKEQTFKKKYEKYTRILNQLTWLNACSSGISVATGISSVAMFATFILIPESTALGAASMTEVIAYWKR